MSRSGTRLALWARRVALACVVAIALGYAPYRLVARPGSQRIAALATELDATRASIDELTRSNAERRRRIAALKNDRRAVEDIARDELGLVYPGELVLRIDPPQRSEDSP